MQPFFKCKVQAYSIYIGSHLALNEEIKILIIKGLENQKRLLTFAASKHHPKSLLNRYGTILRWIKEICNQGDRFARNKPQADHQYKLKATDYQ